MNFNISGLSFEFTEGLKELQNDYNFSLNGKVECIAKQGDPGISKTQSGYVISYAKKSEFYREFVKILNGVKETREHCVFDSMGIMLDCSRDAVSILQRHDDCTLIVDKSAARRINC